jgi:hypothetical protein
MIGAYLTDPVGIKTITRDPVYHEPTYTTVAVMARVEWKTKFVRNIKGEEVVASALVYLPKSITPTHEMLIAIEGKDHSIISIEKKASFSKSHWEVWIS